jgi:hypothetical protein
VVGKEAFQSHMCKIFENVNFCDIWDEDKHKFGYSKWMVERLNDALYNTVPILGKYRKLQDVPMNQEELVAFKTKVNSFSNNTKDWSKKSQKTTHWY